MKTFIGTKLIYATPMKKLDYHILRDMAPPPKNELFDDGYLVEYQDGGKPNVEGYKGYVSWSPEDVFEKAYRPASGVSFGLALEAMKIGKSVRLPHWSEDVIIKAQYPDENSKMTAPYLYVESRFGRVPWKETMIELFSDAWVII